MKKKILLFGLLFVSLVLTACGGNNTSGRKISVYNAGEYIDLQLLKDFEKETGIKVVYDTFASNEDMYIRVTQSSNAYDVVIPSDYMIEKLIKEDRLEKINFDNIKNFSKVDENFKNPSYDPTNEYSVPYFAGTVGIIYNKNMTGRDLNSWKDLWDENFKNQIIMYNSQRDSMAVALKMLGYSLNSTNENELNEAKEALINQKPLVYAYLTDDGRDVLVGEEAAIGVMYSGDAAYMISENPNLTYVIPKEGSNGWTDAFVIPKSVKDKEAAEMFIDFMLRPENAKKNAEYCMGYTSPISEARDLLPDELKDSEVAYPDYSKIPPLESFKDLGEFIKVYDRIWTEVLAN